MAQEMSQQPHKIAVVGFSTFEVGAFEAFFKMVGVSRPPGLLVTREVNTAALIFLNAASGTDIARFLQTEARGRPVIVIGEASSSLNVSVLPRPIRLTSALALANQLINKTLTEAVLTTPQPSAPVVAHIHAKKQDPAPATISPSFWSMTPGQRAPATEVTLPSVKVAANAPPEPQRAPFLTPPIVSAKPMTAPPVSLSSGGVPSELDIPASQKRATGPTGEAAQLLNRFGATLRGNVATVPPSISPPTVRAAAPTVSDLPAEHSYDDILVVDDSDIALKFMQEHLGSFGFRVHLAKSGEECLMMLNQSKFRCVFLDVMMSGMDGYQTCRVVKQRKYPDGSAPTVVMMTSRSGAIDRVRGALAGCDGYLVKPVDETKLIKALFQHKVSNSPQTATNMRKRFDTLAR